eukprot:8692702-Heterocapsa_arctica.AAC.1
MLKKKAREDAITTKHKTFVGRYQEQHNMIRKQSHKVRHTAQHDERRMKTHVGRYHERHTNSNKLTNEVRHKAHHDNSQEKQSGY